jgi:tyrosyl-tRNA synthetase
VMTVPILPGTDGVRKMSKSLDNYVGVTEPPAEIYGKLMSVPDAALETYWRLLLGEEPDPSLPPMDAKRELARRICDRFAGPGSGAEAEERFNQVHQRRDIPDDIPVHELGDQDPVHLPALLRDGFGVSGSEARRMIEQGAVRIDGEPVAADALDLPAGELGGRVLQLGKRRFLRLEAG